MHPKLKTKTFRFKNESIIALSANLVSYIFKLMLLKHFFLALLQPNACQGLSSLAKNSIQNSITIH